MFDEGMMTNILMLQLLQQLDFAKHVFRNIVRLERLAELLHGQLCVRNLIASRTKQKISLSAMIPILHPDLPWYTGL